MDRARLRSEIAGLLCEPHFGPRRQVLEMPPDDAVTVEVDDAPVVGLDAAEATLGVELADPPVRGARGLLHVEPAPALVILELAAGGPKRIAQRNVGVLVSVIGRVCPTDRYFLTGQRDVDVELVQAPLVLVLGGRLGDDMAPHDLSAELLEPRGELANASLEYRRWIHVTEADLQGQLHGLDRRWLAST